MAAAAVVFFQNLPTGDQGGIAIFCLKDVFRLRRISDQPDYERDHRLSLFSRKRKLRHPQPFVVALVLGLVIVVASRLLELLIDEADSIPGLQSMRVEA